MKGLTNLIIDGEKGGGMGGGGHCGSTGRIFGKKKLKIQDESSTSKVTEGIPPWDK